MGLQVAKGGGVEWRVCVLSSLFQTGQNKLRVPGVSSHEGYQDELFPSAELSEWWDGEVAAWRGSNRSIQRPLLGSKASVSPCL